MSLFYLSQKEFCFECLNVNLKVINSFEDFVQSEYLNTHPLEESLMLLLRLQQVWKHSHIHYKQPDVLTQLHQKPIDRTTQLECLTKACT